MTQDPEKTRDLKKDREDALLAAEAAMALRMKDGLVDYKVGFSKRVAAMAAVFVVGAVCGAWLFDGNSRGVSSKDWVGKAAIYHAGSTTRSHTVFAIPQNWPIGSFDGLNPSIDWVYNGASLLILDGRRVVRLDYFHANGTKFAHYMIETSDADLTEPVVSLREGLQAATWTKGGFEYLLIGGQEAANVWNLAKELSSN